MKLFVGALIILALIAGLCFWGTVTCNGIIDGLLHELHEADTTGGIVPPNAETVSDALLSEWEENFFVISMFLPHHHLDEIKEKMVALDSYAGTGEFAEWKEAHMVLEEALLHIRGLMEASLDNIL